MPNTSLELHGRVVQRGTDRGVADLRVVVADQESKVPSLILRSVTDQSGGFIVELLRDDAARLFGPEEPQQSIWNAWAQLYISVYNGRSRLATTT